MLNRPDRAEGWTHGSPVRPVRPDPLPQAQTAGVAELGADSSGRPLVTDDITPADREGPGCTSRRETPEPPSSREPASTAGTHRDTSPAVVQAPKAKPHPVPAIER
jgi:hypothetical protein